MQRVAVVEVDIKNITKFSDAYLTNLDAIEEWEVVKILRIGETGGSVIARIKMKRGKTPSDAFVHKEFIDFEILSKDNDEYTCIVRKNAKALFSKIFSKHVNKKQLPGLFSKYFGKDLFFDLPMTFSQDKIQFKLVGSQKSINGYLAMLERLGMDYKIKALKDYDLIKTTELTGLTQRQKEIIGTAYELGYYNRPKKISSKKLAEIFEVKQATLIEHLRKSEQKILKNVFG